MQPSEPAENSEAMERLRGMSTWAHPLEPPNESLLVNTLMAFSRRRPHVTPHLHGGSSVERLEYERETAWYFWEMLAPLVSMSVVVGKEVLDVGCGFGGTSIYLAESSHPAAVTAFDIPEVFDPQAAAGYALERGITNCTFTTGYGESIPYEDESFDIVICSDVLEHVQDPGKTIGECWRVLRPEGIAIIKFPSFKMLMAHHLGRALNYPGLHYIRPMKVWAAGLNHYLLHNPVHYEPFAKVVATRWHEGVTANLNGLDLAGFRRIIRDVGFTVRHLELLKPHRVQKSGPLLQKSYDFLRSVSFLAEPLSDSIGFVGQKD